MATNPPVETLCPQCGGTGEHGDKADPMYGGLVCSMCQGNGTLDPLPSVTPETYSADDFRHEAERQELIAETYRYLPRMEMLHVAAMLRYAATLAKQVERLRNEAADNEDLIARLQMQVAANNPRP